MEGWGLYFGEVETRTICITARVIHLVDRSQSNENLTPSPSYARVHLSCIPTVYALLPTLPPPFLFEKEEALKHNKSMIKTLSYNTLIFGSHGLR